MQENGFPSITGRYQLGHLNLVEAILDMAGGGPSPTQPLLEQIGLASNTNSKLVEFSLDHALQEDPRFDEVGPSGEILWFLHRLEPEGVLQTPYISVTNHWNMILLF